MDKSKRTCVVDLAYSNLKRPNSRSELKASKTIAGITFITLLKRLCIMIIKQHAGGCVCKYYNLLRFHV